MQPGVQMWNPLKRLHEAILFFCIVFKKNLTPSSLLSHRADGGIVRKSWKRSFIAPSAQVKKPFVCVCGWYSCNLELILRQCVCCYVCVYMCEYKVCEIASILLWCGLEFRTRCISFIWSCYVSLTHSLSRSFLPSYSLLGDAALTSSLYVKSLFFPL